MSRTPSLKCPGFVESDGWISHATVSVFSNYIGVSMQGGCGAAVDGGRPPSTLEIALASSTRVLQRRRSSSSTCSRDQNASIIALSVLLRSR